MVTKFTINNKKSVLDALEKINANKMGFLIILNDQDEVDGVLTDGDIRRAIIKGLKIEDSIQGVYNRNFKHVTIDSKFEEIIDIFKSGKINFLPILDKEGKLVNIITKKQLHIFLLSDKKFDLTFNFLNLDESKLEYQIYGKPWGFYKCTFFNPYTKAKIITIFPQEELSLQEHEKREEHWIIIKGEGKVILEKSMKNVSPGDYVFIPKGSKHKIINMLENENLMLSEVQLGEYFGEDDIVRHRDKYERV